MAAQPHIHTQRLLLRPYTLCDAPAVQAIVSDRDVAATTLAIPHPYPEGGAAEWIATHAAKWRDGAGAVFAITLRQTGALLGSIDLRITPEHRHAEMGYVIGKPHWNHGYASEAAAAMLRFGFETLELNRIYAHHMTINPASGRVMQKIGMTCEGTMRQHIIKWGEPRDIALYGITRAEHRAKSQQVEKSTSQHA